MDAGGPNACYRLHGERLNNFFTDIKKEQEHLDIQMEILRKKWKSMEDSNQAYACAYQELHTSLSYVAKRVKMEMPATRQARARASKSSQAKAFKKSDTSTRVHSDEMEPSSLDDEKSLESLLSDVDGVQDLLEKFNESEQCGKEVFSSLEKVVKELTSLHNKTFELQQEWLRELRVLSCSRDYVSMFRYAVFEDICRRDNVVAAKYATLDSYLSAMTDEHHACRLKRCHARPLHNKWTASVQQLGLTLNEWRLLRELGAKSVSEFHNKFSLAQLEEEVFPASFEKYRAPLLKAAKKLKELGAEEEPPEEEFLG